MTDKKTYEIYLLKKIPLITNVLWATFFISALTFGLFYGAANNKRASPEIVTFYLINTSTIKLLYLSAFSTGLAFFLYMKAKVKKKGLLIFNADAIELCLKNEQLDIPISSLKYVWHNMLEYEDGEPYKKFTVTFVTYTDNKILVRLQKLNEINSFMEKLYTYDKFEIEYFNDDSPMLH